MARKTTESKKPEPEKLPDTPATQLWERIRRQPLDIFGMDGQTVEMYCYYKPVDNNVVYLIPKASAVIPALEETLKRVPIQPGEEWAVEPVGQYISVALNKSKIPV